MGIARHIALPIDVTLVYDVATSRSVPFSAGLLVPPFRWGDFAVLTRSGAMLVIPSTLNFLSCALVTDAPINTSVDVALTPDGQRAYMTLANFGLVVTFAIEP